MLDQGLVKASAESEVSNEIHALKKIVAELMENVTVLSARLAPVLKQPNPTPESPNKEAEAVLSPFGDLVRQSRRNVKDINTMISSLLRDLAI